MTTQTSSRASDVEGKSRSKLVVWILVVLAVLLVGVGIAVWWHNRPITPTVLSVEEKQQLDEKIEAVQEPQYEVGKKEIILTEREVNGLLHTNTNLGDKMKIEFAKEAVHARIHTDLDPDLPFVGGRELKARARFFVRQTDQQPEIVLDDLSVWGISIPNAWLGELKGKNLLSNLGLESRKNRIGRGIESLEIHPGELRINLAE